MWPLVQGGTQIKGHPRLFCRWLDQQRARGLLPGAKTDAQQLVKKFFLLRPDRGELKKTSEGSRGPANMGTRVARGYRFCTIDSSLN